MNIIEKLQNRNIVETDYCDLIVNGQWFEMRGYSTKAKTQQSVTNSHRLAVSCTNFVRLEIHWAGFVDNVENGIAG